MKFLGDGTEGYFGIPARDLSDEEYDALDDVQRALVDGSRLYAPVKAAKADAAPAPDVTKK
jgi:hypothetical protein